MFAFILRDGRALATAYATSNTVAFPFIAQRPTFRPCRCAIDGSAKMLVVAYAVTSARPAR
eukprot:IDg11055t1